MSIADLIDRTISVEEATVILKYVERYFCSRERRELLVTQSDIKTTIETNKQTVYYSIFISLLTFALPLYFNSISEVLIIIFKDIADLLNITFCESRIVTFLRFIIALLILLIVVWVTFSLLRILRTTRRLSMLEKIVDKIVNRRDAWDALYDEALIEYKSFLKEKNNRFIY